MSEVSSADGTVKPTKETYDQFQQAYEYLNPVLVQERTAELSDHITAP